MKKLMSLLLATTMCLFLTACGSVFVSSTAYPVLFDDTEVVVDKTKISELLDAGFDVQDSSEESIPADTELEKNSYYSGLYVCKGDTTYAMIDVVSGSKAIPLSEAKVGNIVVTNDYCAMDRVTFDGVPLLDVTPEVFKEHVKGAEEREDGSAVYRAGTFPIRVEYENGEVIKFKLNKKY